MSVRQYEALVEEAAERASDTGIVDIVDITRAAELGFDTTTFTNDVTVLADGLAYVRD